MHAVILKRPWEVVVSKEGRRVAAYAACWDDPRCVEKREMLENLLRLPPPSRPTGGG